MSVRFAKVKKCLELDDRITFGAHSGRTVSYMLEFEPEYLLWATRQPGLISLSSTAANKLEEKALRAKAEKIAHKAKTYCELTPADVGFDDVPW
jgi:hypothetical protein